ncbi:hypothetical protein HK405_009069, partial [Cladochytrium tenue]
MQPSPPAPTTLAPVSAPTAPAPSPPSVASTSPPDTSACPATDPIAPDAVPATPLTPFATLPHKLLEPEAYLKFLGNADPGENGWHYFCPPDDFVVQFDAPVAITRLGLHPVNTGHSPRTVVLYGDENDAASVTDTSECRWSAFAKIVCPDKNRKRENSPPNGNPVEGTTHFDAYFWGDDSIDPEARPDVLPLKNRILAYPPAYDRPNSGGMKLVPRFPRFASRRWKLTFLDEKDKPLEWIGINYISFYGYESLFPPPEKVQASIHDGVITVSWQFPAEKMQTGQVDRFRVQIHDGGWSMCPQWYVEHDGTPAADHDEVQTFKTTITGLPSNHMVAFTVVAMDKNQNQGLPSVLSKSILGPKAFNPSRLLDHKLGHLVTVKPSEKSAAKVNNSAALNSVAKKSKTTSAPFKPSKEALVLREQLIKERRVLEKNVVSEEAELALSWKEIGQQRKADIMSVLRGDHGFKAASHVFDYSTAKVFLSSTFADTQVERNFIMAHGVPLIQDVCRNLGLSFELVDLRWGITDEMTDNHMTEDICINLVKECRRTSIATSFATKLDEICAHVSDKEALETIHAWYRKDENAIPPLYSLQQISSMASTSNFFDDDRTGKVGAQTIMQRAIWSVLRKDPTLDRKPWFFSITEREVTNGLLTQKDALGLQCLAIRRTFAGTRPEPLPATYFSTGEDCDLQQDLWTRVNTLLPKECFVEYAPDWIDGVSRVAHASYLNDMCAYFVRQVTERIKQAAKHRRLLSPVEKEVLVHVQFAAGRSDKFFGRTELRNQCVSAVLLTDNEATEVKPRFVVIHGESGSGKTSLMCSTAAT